MLALTNLLSLGATARRRVAVEKGIHALEYLQFADHPEVKRAATEALCNMVPDRAMMAHLRKGDKMKLWLALCREDDEKLVSAAIGCLAMAASDVDVARAIGATKGASALSAVFGSSDASLVHRAAYCLVVCFDDAKARDQLRTPELAAAVAAAALKFPEGPAAQALRDAAAALAREVWPDEEEDEEDEETTEFHQWVRHTNGGRAFYRRRGDDGSCTLAAPGGGASVVEKAEVKQHALCEAEAWFEERWVRLTGATPADDDADMAELDAILED